VGEGPQRPKFSAGSGFEILRWLVDDYENESRYWFSFPGAGLRIPYSSVGDGSVVSVLLCWVEADTSHRAGLFLRDLVKTRL
jgi:hypothetical protein